MLKLDSIDIDWLLGGEPFVKYRALIDLLGRKENDKEVIKTKKAIAKHGLIRRIFDRQNKDGYWGNPKDIYTWWPKKDTTFYLLGILADFGFTKENRKVKRACEYVFSAQHSSGGFGVAPPHKPYDCFTGILTESLSKLGYNDDFRLGKAYDWLTKRQRLDGGFWCKDTGQPKRQREHEPSCAFSTLCVLSALAENPEYKNSKIVKRVVEFLFKCWDNRGKIKYTGHDSQIGRGWEKLKYPFTDYRILKYLDTITQFDFAINDKRIDKMIDLLISKRGKDRHFYAESIHKVYSDFDFGQKEQPSRWITLLVYRIVKRIS
jgi:prenyltransferase beta subunit